MNKQMSCLQRLRMKETPELPKILRDLSSLELIELSSSTVLDEIKKEFPATSNKKIVGFKQGLKNQKSSPKNVGVLFSGGQAAGGHNAIIGLFQGLKKLNPESRLFGFLGGPGGLIKNQYVELKETVLSRYLNQGGFDLIGSDRTKIETEEQFKQVANVVNGLNLDALVIIGGDDSHTNAAFLTEYFAKEKIKTQVIGLPKTIDGDLRSEHIEIPFGFDTACKTYSEQIGSIARDALSAKKYYYFVKLMGRSASHVTLECALETHPNLCLIGEEVERDGKTINDIVFEICDMIAERAAQNKDYGVILIPEGILEFIPDLKLSDDIQKQFLQARDPHGNIQLSKIETEAFFIELVEKELKTRKAKGHYKGTFSPVGIFCGYEGRSCFPSIFDSRYCYALGYAAALLIESGLSGYTACITNLTKNVDDWQVVGLPILSLMGMEVRKGKVKPVVKKAFVDLESPLFQMFAQTREDWQLLDDYVYPGPIQFYGPQELTDRITYTLAYQKGAE